MDGVAGLPGEVKWFGPTEVDVLVIRSGGASHRQLHVGCGSPPGRGCGDSHVGVTLGLHEAEAAGVHELWGRQAEQQVGGGNDGAEAGHRAATRQVMRLMGRRWGVWSYPGERAPQGGAVSGAAAHRTGSACPVTHREPLGTWLGAAGGLKPDSGGLTEGWRCGDRRMEYRRFKNPVWEGKGRVRAEVRRRQKSREACTC